LTAGRQVGPLGRPGERAVEQLGLARHDLVPDRIRPRAVSEERETAGIAHRQRPQDQAVEDRKQGRVRADAERERQHGDGREARIPSYLAEAVPEIVCELVHQEVPSHPCLLALVLIAAMAPLALTRYESMRLENLAGAKFFALSEDIRDAGPCRSSVRRPRVR
jgi:hypothetical protein